jgi:serine/threonine protein kinase
MSVVLEVSKEPLPPRAMKVLKPLGGDTQARFMQECAVTAHFEHANIVKVENFGLLRDGSPYLLMERLDGCTLQSVLKEARRPQDAGRKGEMAGGESRPVHRFLTARVVLEIVRQMGRGLACAHSENPPVVHRDIKPANVFLHQPRHMRDVVVKLLDFGIALVLEDDRLGGADAAGTPPYMAPEVATNQAVTIAADVYSFAVLTYELLTLQRPWRESIRSPADVSRVHAQERPVPPSFWRSWIPESVDELLVRALATEPARRPPLGELLESIEELLPVDDGPATHRADLDTVVTTDPGLEGLVRAAAKGGLDRALPPSPLVVMPGRVGADSGGAPSVVGEQAAGTSGSIRSVSVEEVVVGTLDQPVGAQGARGRLSRLLGAAAVGTAAAVALAAAGASKLWSAKAAPRAPAVSSQPVLGQPMQAASAPSWLEEHGLAEPPPAGPPAPSARPSVAAAPLAPARAQARSAGRKPIASGSAPSRPMLAPVDELLAHPPANPTATSLEDMLSHPPAVPASGKPEGTP